MRKHEEHTLSHSWTCFFTSFIFIASTKTCSRSSGATKQSNAVKVRSSADRTSSETYRHAGNKTSTFLSERSGAAFFFFSFELLQDGAPQTLQCPLCPEGVSLSAAKSDRQSGALKAHTPFSPQRLRSQTPGLGSDTHQHTRSLVQCVPCSGHGSPSWSHSKHRVNVCALAEYCA